MFNWVNWRKFVADAIFDCHARLQRNFEALQLLFFSAQGISDTEGEEKNWLENVNAGMTISPGGLRRLKTVVEQDSVESLNDNR